MSGTLALLLVLFVVFVSWIVFMVCVFALCACVGSWELGGPQADTSPEKNYAVEIPPEEYSPGITALQGLAQCKSLLPLGSPVILTTGKPPPGKYARDGEMVN